MLAHLATAGALAGLAAGAYAYAALWPASQVFGRSLVAGNDANEFALTYDDGPNDPWTGRLLEVLARHEVRATFFVIGRFVRERPEIVRAIHAAGHLVGNHTMTHPLLPLRSPQAVRTQLRDCNAAIEDALGVAVQYFRPPHGGRRPDVVRSAAKLGLTTVLWNAMGHDWNLPNAAAQVEARLARGIEGNRRRGRGSNLLLHDGGQAGIGQDRSHSVTATDRILTRYRAEGVRFVRVDAWANALQPR